MANQMQTETLPNCQSAEPSQEELRKYGVVLPDIKMDQELRDLLEVRYY